MVDKDDIIREIQRLADNGEPPSGQEMTNNGKYGRNTCIRRFGTWNAAIQAAGFEPVMHHGINRDELLAEIKRLANGDEPPTSKEMEEEGQFSRGPYRRQWGSWNNALKAAGYQRSKDGKIPEDVLLEEIECLADDNNPPSANEMNAVGAYNDSTYHRRFGSWNEALRQAGYEPTQENNLQKEELQTKIKTLADANGPPTKEEMKKEGPYSIAPFVRTFGSWTDAVRAAGYRPVGEIIPREELITELDRLAEGDTPPTKKEMREEGKYSSGTYQDRWGSWNDALRETGYAPNSEHNISEARLIEALQDLAATLGRAPTAGEMNEQGAFSEGPYLDRFHSWWAAVVRADLRPRRMVPLCPNAYHALHEAATTTRTLLPQQSLATLLFQFTGISQPMVSDLERSWVHTPSDDVFIEIPATQTTTDGPWRFRLPETWQDPHTGHEQRTHLPEFVTWYLDAEGAFEIGRASTYGWVYELAQEAGLEKFREMVELEDGIVPRVRPVDLRFTHGIHLARNGASEDDIRERLGFDYAPSYIDTQEIFIWLEEREDIEHPDQTS